MKIACIQLNSGAEIAENIKSAETLIEKAAKAGAQLVALPENAFLMRDHAEKNPYLAFSQETHPGVQACVQMAQEYGIWLLIGSVAVEGSDGKSLNRSLLIDPQGKVVASYDKIHLFDVQLANGEVYAESARFIAGDKAVIAKAGDARLGMTVCYDVRFPHLYRQLAKAGAQVLAVPAAFTQTTGEAHWHTLLRARAIENGCYVIAPAQTGTHPGGRKTFGHALIIDPWGKVLEDAGTQVGFIIADIDLAMVQKVRASLPSLSHDRPFGAAEPA